MPGNALPDRLQRSKRCRQTNILMSTSLNLRALCVWFFCVSTLIGRATMPAGVPTCSRACSIQNNISNFRPWRAWNLTDLRSCKTRGYRFLSHRLPLEYHRSTLKKKKQISTITIMEWITTSVVASLFGFIQQSFFCRFQCHCQLEKVPDQPPPHCHKRRAT